MSDKKIYRVDTRIEEATIEPSDMAGISAIAVQSHLVRASTKAQAQSHVLKGFVETRVATQDDMLELLGDGVQVEDA